MYGFKVIYITEILEMVVELDLLYKFLLMGNITMDFSKRIYFVEKGSTFGTLDSISLANFHLAKKYSGVLKVKSSIKADLKITREADREHAGIQQEKFIQEIG